MGNNKRNANVVEGAFRREDLVSQAELDRIYRLKQKVQAIEAELKPLRDEAKRRLVAGASVEPGPRTARLETFANVAWKKLVLKRLGQAYVNRVLGQSRRRLGHRLHVN